MARYAPDLAKDRFQIWLSKYHYVPLIVVGLALLAFGGWSCVMWGIFLRVTLWFARHLAGQTPPRTCGDRGAFPLVTNRATTGGWLWSPAAKDGTTTIMRIPSRSGMGLPGGSSM